MKRVQESFIGGINQQVFPTRISPREYFLLQNARVRKDAVEPIKLHKDLSAFLPSAAKIQGLYAAGQYVIIFADGKAYIGDGRNLTYLQQIPGIVLDPTVERIYAALVTSSSLNYLRVSDNKAGGTTSLTSYVPDVSDAGLVIQDGLNQPYVVNIAGIARKLNTYSQWSVSQREYVPIGKQMLFVGDVLYVVSPDGKLIYRSVQGRPLDFMVQITDTGDKNPVEAQGDAASTAISVGGFTPITALVAVTSELGGFFVATENAGYFLYPKFDDLIFGEATYGKLDAFAVGCPNSDSVSDVQGNSVFINPSGINSFNATKALKIASANDIFSARISALFDGVSQIRPCIGQFKDYTFFSVNTTYNQGVLVYDNTLQTFVSFDPLTYAPLQFARVTSGVYDKLYFIDSNNKFYEAFGDSGYAEAAFYFGEFCADDTDVSIVPNTLRAVFSSSPTSGTVNASMFADRMFLSTKSETLEQKIPANALPAPYGSADKDTTQKVTFSYDRENIEAWKLSVKLSWSTGAVLSHISLDAAEKSYRGNDFESQAKAYKSFKNQ